MHNVGIKSFDFHVLHGRLGGRLDLSNAALVSHQEELDMVTKAKGDDEGDAAAQALDTSREVPVPAGVKHADVVDILERCGAKATADDMALRVEALMMGVNGSTSEAQVKKRAAGIGPALKELVEAGVVWSRTEGKNEVFYLESTFPRLKNT
jgi:hypothetical protein